ncbi:MAG: peptidase M56, partial [Oscillospiraceae bacterium]|nr:peptidase M56 [Oscillospiraceae bacterium]
MLDSIFMKVLDMSKTGAIVIIAVIIARLLLKRAPKVISYALWAVVLLRLLCPVSFESRVSALPQMTPVSQNYALADESVSVIGASEAAYKAVSGVLSGSSAEVQNIRTTEKDASGASVYVKTDAADVFILFGQYVWLAGVAAMALWSGVSYLKLRRKTRVCLSHDKNIFIADDIRSPFVMGIARPKIYVPSGLGEKELEYIILHEEHHIKRLDHIIKILAFAALAIHWFNPLVWLAFILAGRDMEMSCDEAVIRKLGSEVRADYSSTLL